jgi:DNA primase large subunit
MMSIIDEDERLAQILNDFDKRHTGSSYAAKGETAKDVVTVERLEQTQTSFPLCVKTLYDHVKKENHLRHFGRLQLGLFFKGVGVPLEEATRFWRMHFTKKQGVDDNRFDKQYLYNIRHMYGKEGKRADYTPYSCMKIIMSSVGPGESHGCPFRHSDGVSLRVKMAEAKIPATGVKEIMELVEKHHYQIACQKYFEWTHHKATVEGGVNHPNQYYDESQKAISGSFKVKTEVSKIATNQVKVYPKKEIKPEELEMELYKYDPDDDIIAELDDPVGEEVIADH